MLNRSVETRHPCPVLDLRGKAFSFPPLSMKFTVGLSWLRERGDAGKEKVLFLPILMQLFSVLCSSGVFQLSNQIQKSHEGIVSIYGWGTRAENHYSAIFLTSLLLLPHIFGQKQVTKSGQHSRKGELDFTFLKEELTKNLQKCFKTTTKIISKETNE